MTRTLFFLILVTFFVLTIPGLVNREVWFDEKASILISEREFPKLLETAARDTHPPLYFLLLKTWSLVSKNHYFLRLPSLLFGMGTILTMWKLAHQLAPTRAAKIATLLLAISPLHIYYASEIRMYGLFLFEALLLSYLFLRFINSSSNRENVLVFVIELALMYTHYYALLVIIALSIWIWFKKRIVFKKWIIIQLLVGLLFLPWALYTVQFPKPACWCFASQIGIPTLFSALAVGGVGIVTLKDLLTLGTAPVTLLFLVTTCLLFALFLKGFANRSKIFSSLITYQFFIPLITISVISFRNPLFSPRAFIFLLPSYLIFVSIGIASLKPFAKLTLVSVIILLTWISLLQSMDPFFTKIPFLKRDLNVEKLEFLAP